MRHLRPPSAARAVPALALVLVIWQPAASCSHRNRAPPRFPASRVQKMSSSGRPGRSWRWAASALSVTLLNGAKVAVCLSFDIDN